LATAVKAVPLQNGLGCDTTFSAVESLVWISSKNVKNTPKKGVFKLF
jgi:hypothetical protein